MVKNFLLKISVYSILLCLPLASAAQMKWNSAYQDYIERYKDLAVEQMHKHHIPASITLAQGLLESGAGRSTLAINGNNHFGIKCHEWSGPRMYKDDDRRNDCFRVYDNARQSFEDHSKFLLRPRYNSLFSLRLTDYRGWARGLKECGYATNPRYAESLINIIELYDLQQYDNAKKYDKFIAEHSGANVSNPSISHRIYYNNKNYYLIARRGDTFRSLSEEVGVSSKKLAKYNELNEGYVLDDGDIVYMEKKRTRADKKFKNRPHVVRAGESMYTIAQKYGIRLKNLYKKNHHTKYYEIREGDLLTVY